VTEFIREEAADKTGHGRTAPASATRSFLRFLAGRGIAPSGLDRAIPAMPRARHSSLPAHLSSEQLARLLQRPATPGPAEYRDRAILSLLAGLGLRAGEVATLDLDDLDWRAGQHRQCAAKCRRERVLPLPREVGAAVAEYLQHARPQRPDRRLFFTLTDPARTIQAAAVSEIVRRRRARPWLPVDDRHLRQTRPRRARRHRTALDRGSAIMDGDIDFADMSVQPQAR
jgi:site-specific recombinase XerD